MAKQPSQGRVRRRERKNITSGGCACEFHI